MVANSLHSGCKPPDAPASAGPSRPNLNLLLVCRDPSWSSAVREATNSHTVWDCDARDALMRLAGIVPNYSHLLLHPQCDDGLFDALFQLTSEAQGSDTELLILGGQPALRTWLPTIPAATSRSVREALMVGPRSRQSADAPFSLEELKAALEGGMISARYQPIVRLSDRRPIALEVLARLDHPDRGTILPDYFVPQIEDAGLAARLTEVIVERAFADLTVPAMRNHEMLITLNFPLDVITRPDAIDHLEARRQAAGLPADRIVIELTESMPVRDFAALRAILDRVRAKGYRAAIDDVSPAVPELEELLRLPFTSVKLDKDLVAHAGDNVDTLRFLTTTVTQAHAAGMLVVAEGVETVDAWNLMRAAGIDGAQGYLLARPLPAAAVPVWLESWAAHPDIT